MTDADKDDPTLTFNTSSNINFSQSGGLSRAPVLGKRQGRSGNDEPEQARKERKKAKATTSEYTGITATKKRFVAQISFSGRGRYLGSFKLQADAARAYDRARLLIPSTLHKHQNFANEEEYQTAREDEIRMRYREEKSQMKLECFVKQFIPKFLNEAQILAKCGLPPKSTLSGESLSTPSSTISSKDSHNYQGFLEHNDALSSDSPDHKAELRKAKVPRTSMGTKLANKCRTSTREELIDLASSDDEDNDESMSISAVVPDESMKSTSKRTESISVSSSGSVNDGEGIVDSRVVETREANASHYIVAENQATINNLIAIQVSPTHNTTTNQDNNHLVLKQPLMQMREEYLNYTGAYWRSSRQSFYAQIRSNGNKIYLGSFKLQTDAAKAYDQAALLIPSTRYKSPNFANEEEYQVAREKEIRERYEQVESQMALDSFVRQCTPKFLDEAQIRYKFGLIPSDSNGRLRDRVQKEDDNDQKGFLADDGKEHFANDSSDDDADLRKAKKPRVSPETKQKKVIDLTFSDDDNDESISISRAVPVESVKSTSMNSTESITASVSVKVGEKIYPYDSAVLSEASMKSTSMSKTESVTASIPSSESLNAKEEIMDSRVVQTGEANAAHSIIAETYPSTEENVAVENRAQTKSGVGSPTVLKNSLMQILEIPIETIEESEVVKDKIMEYCEKLFDCQGCYTNDLLITYLKGLSPGEFDINMNFMLLSHQKQVKKWLENQREEG
ncbi:predicted protein [Chaetoceros tenuissimus]|uniref:AP2/ERF domain-containing protein n=1 Tax=Chaetoceros tenuissimus TaxID=426638 RepID=A0AAD3HD99_9STRA|nr:predicted protein [Chaetoceros tenuissimus]